MTKDPKRKKEIRKPSQLRRYMRIKNRRVTDSTGRIYELMPQGNIVRRSPMRPWRGKSERRQVIKERREDREDFLRRALAGSGAAGSLPAKS